MYTCTVHACRVSAELTSNIILARYDKSMEFTWHIFFKDIPDISHQLYCTTLAQ